MSKEPKVSEEEREAQTERLYAVPRTRLIPIRLHIIMVMHAGLPVTILPAIVAEFRRVPELLFRDVRRVPVASLVVG